MRIFLFLFAIPLARAIIQSLCENQPYDQSLEDKPGKMVETRAKSATLSLSKLPNEKAWETNERPENIKFQTHKKTPVGNFFHEIHHDPYLFGYKEEPSYQHQNTYADDEFSDIDGLQSLFDRINTFNREQVINTMNKINKNNKPIFKAKCEDVNVDSENLHDILNSIAKSNEEAIQKAIKTMAE